MANDHKWLNRLQRAKLLFCRKRQLNEEEIVIETLLLGGNTVVAHSLGVEFVKALF